MRGDLVRWMANGRSRYHADHFRIARAACWLFLFTSVAKLAGAGREIAIAWRLGRGPEVDAYNLAITLSTWLSLAVASVMTVVFVPALVRLRREPFLERGSFLREMNGVAVLTGLVLTGAVWAAAPLLAQAFTEELPEATRELTNGMLRSFAPLALMTVLVGVFAARLQAVQDHRYALAEALPPIVIVLLLLSWHTADALPLMAGTLAGFVWQVLWLARRSHASGYADGGIAVTLRARQWEGLWRGALAMGAGQFAMSFVQPIDQWFAASLGSGEVSTLGYANRIVALGMALGATVISRATLPIFAEGVALGEYDRVRRLALRWAGAMFLLGISGAAFLWLLAPFFVSLMFERGAFSSADTVVVAEAISWGIWQLPPYLAGLVLVSLLASERRYHAIGAIAAANVVSKLIGNVVFAERLGVNGILLASVIMYGLSSALCWFAVRHRIA